MSENLIVLRSVYKITSCNMEPAPDQRTGRYPDCVKRVNAAGDMIISDNERNSGKVFIAENEVIEISDGKTFDLDDDYDAAWWNAIKNSQLIAQERSYRNDKGELVIDGDAKRYGTAEFYVERPGRESQSRIDKKRSVFEAQRHIFNDTKDGLYKKVRLLGKRMDNQLISDVENYLIELAETKPEQIIALYTGGDIHLQLLLLDALDKGIIVHKGKQLYQYGDSTILGASQEACILWMKNPDNKRLLDMIKADTYPESYSAPTDEEGPKNSRARSTK